MPVTDYTMFYFAGGFSIRTDGNITGLSCAQAPSQVHECIWQQLFGDVFFRKGKLQKKEKRNIDFSGSQSVSLPITAKCFFSA